MIFPDVRGYILTKAITENFSHLPRGQAVDSLQDRASARAKVGKNNFNITHFELAPS